MSTMQSIEMFVCVWVRDAVGVCVVWWEQGVKRDAGRKEKKSQSESSNKKSSKKRKVKEIGKGRGEKAENG